MNVVVTFILPGPATWPVGGTRVVYRLGSALVDRGHRVRILHPMAWLGSDTAHQTRPAILASWLKHAMVRDYRPHGWLSPDRRLQLRLIPWISPRAVRNADVVVANGWRTMGPVAALPPRCGCKFVYVQHMETWDASAHEIDAAWKLPLHHVATSDWLVDESLRRGRAADKVPVGIDHDLFYVEVPPEKRTRQVLAFLGHNLEWKGTAIALAAFELARREIPELSAEVFASRPLAHTLPPGVHVSLNPSPERLRAIYNSVEIFLAPSLSEGWDLPACEAMACGAALVASSIPVRSEYATHGENAMLVPPGDPHAAAASVLRLLRDSSLRNRLARLGQRRVQSLTWANSAALFETVLQSRIRCEAAAAKDPEGSRMVPGGHHQPGHGPHV